MRRYTALYAAALLAATACAIACAPASAPLAPLAPLPPGGHRVLFIGNSLTYVNDLPRTLADLAASVGDTIRTASVAYPNYALIDHLTSGDALRAIAADRWEYVIMQQGPTSTTGVDRDTLILAARAFEPYVHAAGGRSALFMVWPDITRRAFWGNCRDSYRLAAQAVSGVFMPAGEAWRIAWATDSTLALYGGDGFHPSPLGTYTAALVMYERITGKDARALPRRAVVEGRTLDAPENTIRVLQEAAHRVNTDPTLQPLFRR